MMVFDKRFSGQTVLITGGLGDIGKAISAAYAKGGAHVAIGDVREEEEGAAFADKLGRCGAQVNYQRLDVSNPEQVKIWIDKVACNLGTPSIVIVNAAIVTLAKLLELSNEQWENEMRVNLNGAFYVSRAAASRMVCDEIAGKILFIGSWAADRVQPHIPAYCVSKAALRMLCKSLALELAPHGIMVNELAPGYVDAGLSKTIWQKNPQWKERSVGEIPVKELISPEEVAETAVWLGGLGHRHITGSTLLMDGGLSLRIKGDI